MLQLTICLDSGGEKPLYQQLYESLAAQIRSGVLKAGDRLPGKRALAGQLAVAVAVLGGSWAGWYLPWLMLAGCVTGIFIGVCAGAVNRALPPQR